MTKATQPAAPIALQAATRPAVFFLLTVFAAPLMGVAHGAPSEGGIDFEQAIRPLLVNRCGDCHGPDTQESRLRLDVRHRAFKGGDFGTVILPGKAADSELIKRVTHGDPERAMPPDDPLSADEIRLLTDWIDAGANWPETAADRLARETDRDPRLDHWAWQPLAKPAVPTALPGQVDSGNPIDRFLAKKLAEKGLAPAPLADRRTLIRRLSFDLTGLPPTPAEVEAFLTDPAADAIAYERLLDRLLTSPHYGERWARHWLDIAHYADTHGFERDQLRPTAWRYRDWVIKAFNDDLPYDEFLRRQLAGDVIAPNDPAFTVAAGFLTAGPWDFVGQIETKSPVLRRQARADDLDDMITQVMTAACGVTINCSRCHDHKLDPISQEEYYGLTAVFAGVKRAERVTSQAAEQQYNREKKRLESEIASTQAEIHTLTGRPIDLADIVGGGDGRGTGTAGGGIHPGTGKAVPKKPIGYLNNLVANTPKPGPSPLVNAVFIPNGPDPVPLTTTGITVSGLPATALSGWDAIRNGPVKDQFSTVLDEVDYAKDGHSMLGIHANAGISFDLTAIRELAPLVNPRFRTVVGYGGRTSEIGADFFVCLDGEIVADGRIGRDDGGIALDIPLAPEHRFLTLISTDAGNGISHDQIFFGDPWIEGDPLPMPKDAADRLETARTRLADLEQELKALKPTDRFYGPVAGTPPVVKIQLRGNPETTAGEVTPQTISALAGLSAELGTAAANDAERRLAFAAWVTDPANPLTPRVIVNRLWHHHFGTGIFDTPSDVGLGGGRPTHPELLDWLAGQLLAHDWSLKAMHRLICTSHAYRQQSHALPGAAEAAAIDAGNRLLWRQNPRRLDAESLRDATLSVSGCLNPAMFGPGYRDFDYEEAYAPVYTYITPDRPELWRRTIYRFVVRSTPHSFLTTLDCPNPANLTPARIETTTALQSLALLNNGFQLRQAEHWAKRLEAEAGANPADQVGLAFQLAFSRSPTAEELAAAVQLIAAEDLVQFCRMLLSTNEFVTID